MNVLSGNLSTQTHGVGLRHRRRMSRRGDPTDGAYHVKSMCAELILVHQPICTITILDFCEKCPVTFMHYMFTS